MKKNPDSPFLTVLFVCSDPSLRTLVKTLASTRFPTIACVARSTLPPILKPYDLLVLPAGSAPLNEELETQSRVIAYGPIEHMPQAFLQGCIDYLAEPWHPEELFYRALRFQTPLRIFLEGVECHILPGRIQSGHRTIPLTALEFSLLSVLVRAKGTIIPRFVLEQLIPGPSSGPASRRVDAHMARLRKKLSLCLPKKPENSFPSPANSCRNISESPPSKSPLRSARGLGYYLVTD